MKLLATLTTAWLAFMACGQLPAAEQSPPFVDDAIAPYMALFSEAGQVYVGHISARFATITDKSDKGHVVAYCYYATSEIVIDPVAWKRFNIVERELLVFHELGHCVLGIVNHRDGIDDKGCAVSVMNSVINNAYKCYLQKHDYYMNELFGRK